MEVFVVLSETRGGLHFSGVRRTSDQADQHATTVTFGTNRLVRPVFVRGHQPDPNKVYSAEYLEVGDIQYFEDIFGNYEDARKAVGPKGAVLSHVLKAI
jgi:hypothetical protein